MPSYQQPILQLGYSLGYFTKEDEGNCQGLAMVWLSACISGQEDTYNALILEIVTNPSVLLKKIEAVKEKLEQHKSLTYSEEQVFQYIAFFEQIAIFQNTHRYSDLFNNPLTVGDFEAISPFVSAAKLESVGHISEVYSEVGVYTQPELSTYLQEIAKIIDSISFENEKVIGFNFNSHNHAIGVTYNTKSRNWKVMDINQGDPKDFGEKELSKAVNMLIKGFQVNQVAKIITGLRFRDIFSTKYTALQVKLITTFENNPKLDVLKSKLDEFKKSHLITITPELAQRTGVVNMAFMAAGNGDSELLETLARNGANLSKPDWAGHTPAWFAAFRGKFNTIEVLAKHKADLTSTSKTGETPIYIATTRGDAKIVEILVKNKVDVNQKNFGVPLVYAAVLSGASEVLRVLLAHGADPKVTFKDYIPAHIAAINGDTQILQILAENGADLTTPMPGGETPIYLAAQYGKTDAIKMFLKFQIDPREPCGKEKITPAHIAAFNGHTLILEILYEKDPSILQVQDLHGKTPLDIIKEKYPQHLDLFSFSATKGKYQLDFFSNTEPDRESVKSQENIQQPKL